MKKINDLFLLGFEYDYGGYRLSAGAGLGAKRMFDACKEKLEEFCKISSRFISTDTRSIGFIEESIDNFVGTLNECCCNSQIPIILTGCHFSTYLSLKTISRYTTEPIYLIQFDAHKDLYIPKDKKAYDHASQIYRLIEEGIILKENILQIGIRDDIYTSTSLYKVNSVVQDVKNISSEEFLLRNIQDIGDEIIQFAKDKQVYVSLDIDCLDPSFAPGVGAPIPGGLLNTQLFYLLKLIIDNLTNIVGMDIVEYIPLRDIKDTTFMNAFFALQIMLKYFHERT